MELYRVKKKKRFVKYAKKMRHVFLFPSVFLYFEILLRVISKTGVFRGFLWMLLLTIGAGFLCSGITALFPKRVNRRISIVLLFFTGIVFISECLIRESFQVYMTFGAMFIGAGGVVKDFAGEMFRTVFGSIPVIFLFLLPGILYVLFGKRRLPARRYPIQVVMLVFAASFAFGGVGILGASKGAAGAIYKSRFEFNTAIQQFGLLTGIRLHTTYALFGNGAATEFVLTNAEPEVFVGPPKATDYGEHVSWINFENLGKNETNETLKSMHAYVNTLTPAKKNKYTGLFEGKNLILICAEAFSDKVTHKELTPTLYRLSHNGIYFSDYYQPAWGGSTSSGEYSFLTGLVPMDGVETIQKTSDNLNYYTLGNKLKGLGYYSSAFHNGSYDYYDRHLTHQSLGYDEFLGQGNGLEEITGAWPGDDRFFDKTMDVYMDKQPFSIYYMTVSGHAPYVSDDVKTKENMKRVKEVLGEKKYKETTMNYFCYQLELEKALTTMVAKLEEAGIADDTVICMTSDHYPYGLAVSKTFGNTEDYVSDLYGHEIETDWDRDKSTWILWSGSLENEQKEFARKISDPTCSLDIVPTLLNLFGIEYDSRLLVGRDVFSYDMPLALWNTHSWITDKGKYDADSGKFTPKKGVKVEKDYVEKINNIVSNKIKFSDQILENDYYRILVGG